MPSQTFSPTDNEGCRIVLDSEEHGIYLGHRFSAFYKQIITGLAGTSIISITSNQGKIISAVKEGLERVFKPNTIYAIGLTPAVASMTWILDDAIEEVAV